jgi:uncharacterized protein YjbI with pentapeptide repeats
MLAAVAAVVITAFVVTTWLYAIASGAKPGTDRANSRLDAVRTGLAAGAGAGAAVGLMLAFRRQHHQEIATVLTDLDATERRITELYTKAVEQLGSDKAPVRLGGLYALERLAQDNLAQRQTIVNVICAYLRMPFSPTPPASKPEPEPEPEATEDRGEPAPEMETRTDGIGDAWQQERQARLTAQGILAKHLRNDRAKEQRPAEPPSPRFWPGIRLDLAGATLIDFNLGNSAMADADFHGATFTGEASFFNATFSGTAVFGGATFSGTARFGRATFSGDARFSRATFSGDAEFGRVTFGDAWFDETTFSGDARFDEVTFSGEVGFYGATFSSGAFTGATFSNATFSGIAVFSEATFGEARFNRATFGLAEFSNATFSGTAVFSEATFSGTARFSRATFSGTARFDWATFSGGANDLSFDRSRVTSPDATHLWPTGWGLEPDGSGGYTVVRAKE